MPMPLGINHRELADSKPCLISRNPTNYIDTEYSLSKRQSEFK